MIEEKEINEVLKKIDEGAQKMVGKPDCSDNQCRMLWVMRTTLLWVKGDLKDIQ